MYALARHLLFSLPPERAHCAALAALEARRALITAGGRAELPPPPRVRPQTVMGLTFQNPVGLAAGFDKNAAHTDALSLLGFGFIEAGGITPRPQPGNPAPRVFRLPQAEAIINRLGLNNVGAAAAAANLQKRRAACIVGVNLGKNADTPPQEAINDYTAALRQLYAQGDFFTLNVSSPNTKNLRDWQRQDALAALLAAATAERDALAEQHGRRAPLAVKLAPDLSDDDLLAAAAVIDAAGADGVIAANTTTARPPHIAALPHGAEAGGLSGRPLAARATAMVRLLRGALPARIAIIGVGGILSPQDALERLEAGADLLQLYTGLIYRGAQLPRQILRALQQTAHVANLQNE